jgi:hypothetical protein
MKRAFVVVAFLSVLSPAIAHADSGSVMHVEGTHTTQVVPCESLCTASEFTGDLEATSEFTLISLTTTQIPNVSRYVGDLVLHTDDGDLIGQDVGYWNTATGNYVDLYQISEGTGVYEDATGYLFLWGALDPLTGIGSSRYSGFIVWP